MVDSFEIVALKAEIASVCLEETQKNRTVRTNVRAVVNQGCDKSAPDRFMKVTDRTMSKKSRSSQQPGRKDYNRQIGMFLKDDHMCSSTTPAPDLELFDNLLFAVKHALNSPTL